MIAAVAAQTASLFTLVCTKQNLKQFVTAGSANHRAWQAIVKHLANIASDNPEEPLICNLLAGLFQPTKLKPRTMFLRCWIRGVAFARCAWAALTVA